VSGVWSKNNFLRLIKPLGNEVNLLPPHDNTIIFLSRPFNSFGHSSSLRFLKLRLCVGSFFHLLILVSNSDIFCFVLFISFSFISFSFISFSFISFSFISFKKKLLKIVIVVNSLCFGMSNFIPSDVISSILQYLPPKTKPKVLTSSYILPKLNLLTDILNLDDKEVCFSFKEDDFKILIRNTNLDRQKLFNCVIRRNLIEYVEILLKVGPTDLIPNLKRVNPADRENYAIILASQKGHTEVVRLLLKVGPRVNSADRDNLAIQIASQNGHTEVVKVLLMDPRVNPDVNYNLAINKASENGRSEVVKVLLEDKRVNPADLDNYAIRWASQNGHTKVVKLLLKDKRVNPADRDNYAIHRAFENGYLEVVRLLANHPSIKTPKKEDLEVLNIVLK